MSPSYLDLSGAYTVTLSDGSTYQATLPGTLDTNGIGKPDTQATSWHPDVDLGNAADANTGLSIAGVITTRLKRKHTYTGKAVFAHTLLLDTETLSALKSGEKRAFLHIERSRVLSVSVDEIKIAPYLPGTLSTQAVYELTAVLAQESEKKAHMLALSCDNSYPSLPASAITYSSAATDETQTNWNGIIGAIQLEITDALCITAVRVYPQEQHLSVQIDIDAPQSGDYRIRVESAALSAPYSKTVSVTAGRSTLELYALALSPAVKRWDEDEGNLYDLTAHLSQESRSTLQAEKTVRFGVRSFKNEQGRFTINGRRLFLRSEANCAVFPETGHLPMDTESWRKIFATYASYGVNLVRFHSHCPCEAAFSAADERGLLIQCELSNWDPKTAFGTPEAVSYYTLELVSILHEYANHPSFVMLTLGNELHYDAHASRAVASLLQLAKQTDRTRLYANASNPFYGHEGPDSESDFYTSAVYKGTKLRGTGAGMTGHINTKEPNTQTTYQEAVSQLRADEKSCGKKQIPVFSFEVGQYEVLPDFAELTAFTGVTEPENLQTVYTRVQNAGFLTDWERRVSASGELSLRCYREEIEAALRTSADDGLSGISLLGLQDFPGQGTALVGMLNSHLQPKPYAFATPERFKRFFAPVTVLGSFVSYTYATGDTLTLTVHIANYGKKMLTAAPVITLKATSMQHAENKAAPIDAEHPAHPLGPSAALPPANAVSADTLSMHQENGISKTGAHAAAPVGTLTTLSPVTIPLSALPAGAYTLTITFAEFSAEYPLWLYEPAHTSNNVLTTANGVHTTHSLSEALSLLSQGKKVFFEPRAADGNFTKGMETHFSTDFWSVGTFAFQSGYMGILTEPTHPIFSHFPTAFHADWQWWRVTHHAHAFEVSDGSASLITALDCYARLRRTSLLAEFRCNGGTLIISGMELLQKQEHIECQNLLRGILDYEASDACKPQKELDKSLLSAIIQ